MNDRPFISQFSPQWTNPAFLEKILVQRHELLRESVELIRESILTGNKHHLLFVGPRGVGKTNLVTLIHHRLSQDVELKEKMRFAWLNEDEVATSFLRLLVLIYRNLSDRYPTEFPASTINGILGQDAKLAQENLATALLRDLAGRTVVLIVENLDTIFRAMPQGELLNWRAFVQNHPVFATLGTAQALFDGISDREEPFFGFFDARHLDPLTVDEARTLLENLARLNDHRDLLEYLLTPTGKSRVRTIRELSGGNPRLFVIFSELLTTAKDLDDLVRPFEEMVDRQLTSYYQERLRWLSPQQREIIQLLSRTRHPVAVKSIAEGLFTSHNSITGQLKQLRDMRYLNFHQNGREVLYELAEPLMRLALQVKETHDRRPLALIVDFLRVVYEREEIEERLAECDPASRIHAYYSMAVAAMDAGLPNPHHEFLRYEIKSLQVDHCDDEALARAHCLVEELKEPTAWLILGQILLYRKDWDGVIKAMTELLEYGPPTAEFSSVAHLMRAVAYEKKQQFEAATDDYTCVISQLSPPRDQLSLALVKRGHIQRKFGQTDAAFVDYDTVCGMNDAPDEQVAEALVNRATLYEKANRESDALADYNRVIEKKGVPANQTAKALLNRGLIRSRTNLDEAIRDYTKVIEQLGGVSTYWMGCALSLRAIAVFCSGIAKVGQLLEVGQKMLSDGNLFEAGNGIGSPCAWTNCGSILHDYSALIKIMSEGEAAWVEVDQFKWISSVVVECLLYHDLATQSWANEVSTFLDQYARQDSLSLLGDALVQHLPKLAASPLNHAAWDAWADSWETSWANVRTTLKPEEQDKFEIPLRLLRTGIEYLKTKKENRLLVLPSEERKVLRHALGLLEEKAS